MAAVNRLANLGYIIYDWNVPVLCCLDVQMAFKGLVGPSLIQPYTGGPANSSLTQKKQRARCCPPPLKPTKRHPVMSLSTK